MCRNELPCLMNMGRSLRPTFTVNKPRKSCKKHSTEILAVTQFLLVFPPHLVTFSFLRYFTHSYANLAPVCKKLNNIMMQQLRDTIFITQTESSACKST